MVDILLYIYICKYFTNLEPGGVAPCTSDMGFNVRFIPIEIWNGDSTEQYQEVEDFQKLITLWYLMWLIVVNNDNQWLSAVINGDLPSGND